MLSITIKGLKKAFGKNKVLKGIDLDIKEPKIITILGPNASGKTTLIKAVLGMVIPDEGKVLFDGQDVKGKWDYKKDINYLPQIAQFPENMRVHELISLIEDLRGEKGSADTLIELFELQPYLTERVSILSGGTKQKVNVVLAFMYNNPILILDEPTNGLDPVALVRLKNLIKAEKKAGKCIIITTHIMQLVEELSDEIIYMLEGHIHFKGTVNELKSKFDDRDIESCIAKMLESQKNGVEQSTLR